MGIHVNIGELKDRVSELVAAAERGEEIVIARAGRPVARLGPLDPNAAKLERRARWEAALGCLEGLMPPDAGDLFSEPEFSDDELDEFEAAILEPRTGAP